MGLRATADMLLLYLCTHPRTNTTASAAAHCSVRAGRDIMFLASTTFSISFCAVAAFLHRHFWLLRMGARALPTRRARYARHAAVYLPLSPPYLRRLLFMPPPHLNVSILRRNLAFTCLLRHRLPFTANRAQRDDWTTTRGEVNAAADYMRWAARLQPPPGARVTTFSWRVRLCRCCWFMNAIRADSPYHMVYRGRYCVARSRKRGIAA